jgi:hypothetical protein
MRAIAGRASAPIGLFFGLSVFFQGVNPSGRRTSRTGKRDPGDAGARTQIETLGIEPDGAPSKRLAAALDTFRKVGRSVRVDLSEEFGLHA